jgi:hypothetical protein
MVSVLRDIISEAKSASEMFLWKSEAY